MSDHDDTFVSGKHFESEFAFSKLFDFNVHTKLKTKYIILSAPRTGSTMLSSALYNTGLAGVPLEYFHNSLLKLRGNPELRPNELNVYLEEMIERRTSPNGYFGLKLHFGQFEYLFGANPVATEIGIKFIGEFDRHVLIYRRDKILQAISSLLASESRTWSRTRMPAEELLGREFQQDDVIKIMASMNTFIQWDLAWRKILEKLGASFITVAYEDLCDRPHDEITRICNYLGITLPEDINVYFSTVKQTNSRLTQELKFNFLKYIGAVNENFI